MPQKKIRFNLEKAVRRGIVIASLGLIDDFSHIPPLWRLLVQSLVVIGFLLSLSHLPSLELGTVIWHWHILGACILFLGFVWLINLYNFMDGIDGLAASEAIFVSCAAALLLYLTGSNSYLLWVLILPAA